MSKRNFVLFILVVAVLILATLAILYFRKPQDPGSGGSGSFGDNFFGGFPYFGRSGGDTPGEGGSGPSDVSGDGTEDREEIPAANLKKVSGFPVAGYGVFMRERYNSVEMPAQEAAAVESVPVAPATELAPSLKYVEKATGNIYQTFADKIDERKLSSTMIPMVREALFGLNGESVIMRYLKKDSKTIETFAGKLPKEYAGADGGVVEIEGTFLSENISDVSLSPDSSKIFYLSEIKDEVAGISFDLASGAKTQVFDSPFTEWLSFWPKEEIITLTTKPSSGVPGYMYSIDPSKKTMNKVLSGVNGLTTLTSPDGKKILWSDNSLFMKVFDADKKDSSLVGVRTMPEKCVWGKGSDVLYCAVPKFIPGGQYPDAWYQGEVSFMDEIWKIYPGAGSTMMILDPSKAETPLETDAIKLALDQNEEYLFFINKKDSYLWELPLK